MKRIKFLALGAAAALSFSSAAFAQHEGHGQMTAEQHKQMMAGDGAASEKVTHATGVVKAVDAAKGTITIAHDPIAAKKWPAMTMTFKLNKGGLGKVRAGQRVKFCFEGEGSYTVTKMTRI